MTEFRRYVYIHPDNELPNNWLIAPSGGIHTEVLIEMLHAELPAVEEPAEDPAQEPTEV